MRTSTSRSHVQLIVNDIIEAGSKWNDINFNDVLSSEQIQIINDRVKCAICQSIVHNGVLACHDEHMFCTKYLIQAVQQKPVCPVCRGELNISGLSRFIHVTLRKPK